MVKDRRFESRWSMNIGAVLYLDIAGVNDISSKVKNISENGICFEIEDKDIEYFHIDDHFQFCIFDTTMKKLGIENELITGKAIIRYMNKIDENHIDLGCVAQSTDLNNYIRHKIVCYTIEAHG